MLTVNRIFLWKLIVLWEIISTVALELSKILLSLLLPRSSIRSLLNF